MTENHYRRTGDDGMPETAKWVATFINRIGFPIFAFCLLSYFYFVGLKENTKALSELRDVMLEVKKTIAEGNK